MFSINAENEQNLLPKEYTQSESIISSHDKSQPPRISGQIRASDVSQVEAGVTFRRRYLRDFQTPHWIRNARSTSNENTNIIYR